MTSPRPPHAMLLAPGAPSGGAALRLPAHNEPFPPVDAPLVEPETRQEMLHGRLIYTMPAHEPHATLQFDLASVLHAHVAPGYKGAVEMLTRTNKNSEFAPDASVFPADPDPVTGGRQLEDLAFEIVSEQSLAVATDKAAMLVTRGVRRVFCIVVKSRSAFEWSTATGGWAPLSPASSLSDRCFVHDLPVHALVDATAADMAIVQALLARSHPVLSRALADREAQGEARGRSAGLALLVRFFERKLTRPLTDAEHARVVARLDTLGADRLGDAALDLSGPELAAWLADDNAR